MKKTLKLLALLLIAAIIISTICIGVNAESTSDENVVVTISTDKSSYAATDTAHVSVKVENKSDRALDDVVLFAQADNWLLTKGNNSNVLEIGKMKKGESKKLAFDCVLNRSAKGLGLFDKIILFFSQLFNKPSAFETVGNTADNNTKASKTVNHGGAKVNITATCFFVTRLTDEELLNMYNRSVESMSESAKSFSKKRTVDINRLEGGAVLKIGIVQETVNNFFGVGTKNWSYKNSDEQLIQNASLAIADIKDLNYYEKNGELTVEFMLNNGLSYANSTTSGDITPVAKTGIITENNPNGCDYKSAKNIYDFINGIDGASATNAEVSTENCKVCAVINVKTGKLTGLTVIFDFTADITEVKYTIAKVSTFICSASTEIMYSNILY
ncbi:MAG: hypothetical protein IJK60_04300 [Clostridia bacterium]|nr:hypothetical protein [Clostridia bacterium]